MPTQKITPFAAVAQITRAAINSMVATINDGLAAFDTHTHTPADVGAVPTSRKINGKALTADVTLTALDVGARANDWLPTLLQVGGSRSNLLDVSDFRSPVNQRSVSGTIASGNTVVFFYDKWQTAKTNLILNSNNISLAWDGVNGTNGYIIQKIEGALMFSKTVTVSVEINGVIYYGSVTIPTTANAASGHIPLVGGATAYVTNWGNQYWSMTVQVASTTPVLITRGKVEDGAASTLANDPPPNIWKELDNCQRYQFVTTSWFRERVTQVNANTLDFHIKLPVTPRIAPNTNTFTSDKFLIKTLSGVTQSGFTCTLVQNTGAGLMVRFEKNAHGLADAYLEVVQGTVFDFNM